MPGTSTPDSVLFALHKGLGIRRPNLISFTKPAWCLWELVDESPAALRAKLVWSIGATLVQIGDEQSARLGRAAYNLDTDPAVNRLDFLQRLDCVRGPRSSSWAQRRFRDVVQAPVIAALRQRLDVPPDRLREICAKELGLAADAANAPASARRPTDSTTAPRGCPDLISVIRKLYTSPYPDVIEQFLKTPVIIPRGTEPGLIVTRTRRAGAWVSVYSDVELMNAHLHSARLPWNGFWDQVSGASLVRMLRSIPEPVGLVLNPPPRPDADISRTLPLTASTIRRIWWRL